MKHNGERRPEDIQAEIQRTRSNMDATLNAIENRFTPGQLMDRGMDYLRHNGGMEFVQNLGQQAKNNPMPVALMGIGLAWLMATGRSGPGSASSSGSWDSATSRMSDMSAGAKDRLGQATGSAKERLGHATGSAKERIGQARESLSSTMQATRERISGAAASARSGYHRARGGYDSMVRDYPLALGAVGLAIGAVIASALPRTRKEDELMGEQRDRLAEQAKQAGKEQLDKAKDVAKSATDAAKDAAKGEAQKQGMPKPATPAQSVGATGAGQPPRRGPGGG